MRTWPALLLAPSLALFNLCLTYALVGPACSYRHVGLMHAATVLCLAACLACTALALGKARDTRDVAPPPSDAAGIRANFLARVATMTGALSSLAIVAMWIPQWVLSPCAV